MLYSTGFWANRHFFPVHINMIKAKTTWPFRRRHFGIHLFFHCCTLINQNLFTGSNLQYAIDWLIDWTQHTFLIQTGYNKPREPAISMEETISAVFHTKISRPEMFRKFPSLYNLSQFFTCPWSNSTGPAQFWSPGTTGQLLVLNTVSACNESKSKWLTHFPLLTHICIAELSSLV